jgi:protein phosphatase
VERNRADLDAAAKALVGAANRGGGEDNITVVLFEIADVAATPAPDEMAQMPAVEPDIEDTLSEEDAVPAVEVRPLLDHDADTDEWETAEVAAAPAPAAAAPASEPAPRPRRRRGRLLGWTLLVVALAGIGLALVWGLARAHFVGAEPDGRVAIYQGVPWDLGGGIRLYRPVYRSRLITAELSQSERRSLFNHDLVSYATARARLTPFEQGLAP